MAVNVIIENAYKDKRWLSSGERKVSASAQIPTQELTEILLSSGGVCV